MDKKLLLLLALLPLITPISLQALPMNVVDRMDQARPQPRVDPIVVLEVDSKDVGSKNKIKKIEGATQDLTVNVVYVDVGGEVTQGYRDNIRNDIIEALDGKLGNLPNLRTVTIDLSNSNFSFEGINHISLDSPGTNPQLTRITLIGPNGVNLTEEPSLGVSYAKWLIRLPSNFVVRASSAQQCVWVRQ